MDMATPNHTGQKRKVVSPEAPELTTQQEWEGHEELDADLEGILSQGEDEVSEEDVSSSEEESEIFGEEEEEGLGSEEVPSSEDEEEVLVRKDLGKLSSPIQASKSDDKTSIHANQRNGTWQDAKTNGVHGGNLEEENDKPNYTVTTDANGNPRYVYKDIEPVYDSDDSDAPTMTNTIGNIPLSFYDGYPHIGYDINGKKIMRPAKGEALDALLNSIELPKGWTGLTDPETGKPLELSREELEVLKKLTRNEVPEEGYDPYPDMVEYFTSKTEIMPLSAAPEPKRRFVPSKYEHKRIMKMVKAIREGRIKPYRPPEEQEDKEEDVFNYDVWENEAPRADHPMHIPAPKLPRPGFDLSYRPPREYLPNKAEREVWETADEEDRDKEYLPTEYDALRKVPGYSRFIKEIFERSLDLYLAPRVRRNKLNIDPESLLPNLPKPDELRPFPTTCAAVFRGHEGRVRSCSVDPNGIYLASGGDDGTVRVWELLTGRQLWMVRLTPGREKDGEAVDSVRWRPTKDTLILAAAAGEIVYFAIPLQLAPPDVAQRSHQVLDAGWGHGATNDSNIATGETKEQPGKWERPSAKLVDAGVLITVTVRSTVKVLTWHRRGDHIATVSPRGQSHAVAIHTLSSHKTQLPFRRLRGLPQTARFHPSKPIFFVATQQAVRAYDLAAQTLTNTLQPGARWISSLDVHPGGSNVLVGAYDRRLLWHDLDLSPRPYKTMRYHSKGVRAARFHQGGTLPLFADASDDGTVQVFHGSVVGDLLENATIVPLKVLRGHKVVKELGVMDLDWAPREPWCVSAGADGTCRLWT
ncbi:NUC169 domain-containing protein [Lineolata rhizophorae]|uniref:Ribosome biogenesis protein ERB1 n=1 Tax=Lineolata rhizophorae TaxID=578093 RepID=A0A6A6PB80_9PEZI|nr:NUC169 domain-containing protein [Lineolata rhizophorae]